MIQTPHCIPRFKETFCFFFSSRRRHTRSLCDWSSDVCSSDLRKSWVFALALLVGSMVAPLTAQAQTVAEFYRGKTVNVYIGVGVGGEYDIQARLVARHIGKHIPGKPTVVPQNMTGAEIGRAHV